jgi:hypothetical protein
MRFSVSEDFWEIEREITKCAEFHFDIINQ